MSSFDVLGPYLIAMLMGMGSMCVYVWGVMAGAFGRADDAAIQFYLAETANDEKRKRPRGK